MIRCPCSMRRRADLSSAPRCSGVARAWLVPGGVTGPAWFARARAGPERGTRACLVRPGLAGPRTSYPGLPGSPGTGWSPNELPGPAWFARAWLVPERVTRACLAPGSKAFAPHGADGVDGVRLRGRLVRPDPHYPVLAAARLARRTRGVSQLKQSRGLPGQHLVGQALEGLSQHDQPAGGRVTRAEVQVGQPALAPPVAPLGCEHHQVKGVPWLYLDPLAASAAGRVAAVQRLDDDALVTAGDGIAEERLGNDPICRDGTRDDQTGRHDPGEQCIPLTAGHVDQVRAIEMQEIEEEWRQRQAIPLTPAAVLARHPGRGDLEGPGASVRIERHGFPVEHRCAQVQAQHGGGDLRNPGGNVIERPGEDRHLSFVPVRLDPDSVNLPFQGRRRYPVKGGSNAYCGCCEHGPQRPADS